MILVSLLLGLSLPAAAKDHRLAYTLHFDSADLTSVTVELRVRNAPASMQLTAHAHPEYDDKYWRYVDDLRARSANSESTISRIDSVRWQLNNPAGDVIISYRVKFPQDRMPRAAWKPFLASTGGLIGGPHSFLYPIGLEKEAASVTLDIPSSWKVGSGLAGNSSARQFIAPNLHTLMESPMLVGRLSEWTFNVNSIPHRIFYWRLPNAASFDSVAFVSGIQKIATQAFDLFGSAPYREYTFILQDGAYSGGLEHPNSLTLGALSEELAKDPNFTVPEIAHEFFHTWNLMAIKPREYREVDYRIQAPVAELWFSEGLTIFYSDLIQRRAGLPVDDSTRVRHLAHLIERYYSMPGLARFSAEHVSRVAYNASPDALGDYSASAHLQGEIIGDILDFRIRDATNGEKSIDDVMRLMYQRFNAKKFTSQDVESVVDQVCGCTTRDIFDGYVFNAGAIDFNRYLEPMGLKSTLTWVPARDANGKLQPDLRAWAYERGGSLKFRVSDPESVWGKAGLHTGDDVVSINGVEAKTWPEFRAIFGKIAVGDSTTLVIHRGPATISKTVIATGYDRPNVTIEPTAGASEKQQRLLNQWATGKPDRSSSM